MVLFAMGGANLQASVNKDFINNVNQPFLFPNSQPQDLEKSYKSCPPNKQDTLECQVYVQCDKADKACLDKAKKTGKQ